MNRLDLDFPFHVADTGRSATTGYSDHVRDLIEQVLFTRPGERVNRPDFGCGLLDLVFEPSGPELAAALQVTVRTALHRWLGDVITVQDLAVEAEDSQLRVEVRYVVLATGQQRIDVIPSGGV